MIDGVTFDLGFVHYMIIEVRSRDLKKLFIGSTYLRPRCGVRTYDEPMTDTNVIQCLRYDGNGTPEYTYKVRIDTYELLDTISHSVRSHVSFVGNPAAV